MGANNGAAGTAIVVQLAREVAAPTRPKRAPEVRFVLFDGEEPAEGLPEEQPDFYSSGLRGSRAYVDAPRRRRRRDGAARLRRQRRPPAAARGDLDAGAVGQAARRAPRRAGKASFFPDGTGPAITDDHTPFLRAGIPAIDLIDWSYEEGHTLEDGLDKLSVRAVDGVGETVRRLIDAWRP